MEHLIQAVRHTVKTRSWYAATALSLMLPDSCAAIEEPGPGLSKQRYTRWAEHWLHRHFTAPTGKVFLSGAELYLFRCAFLHAGDFMTSGAEPHALDDSAAMFEVLNHVTLYDDSEVSVVPSRNMTKSGSKRTTSYSMGVGWFCESICSGVESWLSYAHTKSNLGARIERMAQTGVVFQLP